MTRLLGVLGSVTPPGRLSSALTWTLEAARSLAPDVETSMLNLGAYTIGFADGRPLDQLDDDSPKVVKMVQNADAVLFATPVYRATYTGALKNLLDLIPVDGLMGKPCGIIAMGATQHHYLGVDSHLRDVLMWFGALVAPTSVYLASADFVEGVPTEGALSDLCALTETVLRLRTVAGSLGPAPLAAR